MVRKFEAYARDLEEFFLRAEKEADKKRVGIFEYARRLDPTFQVTVKKTATGHSDHPWERTDKEMGFEKKPNQ
ncbi:MAG TPA: hypothetical protein VF189_00640 [Patescibacteria group bacterium]